MQSEITYKSFSIKEVSATESDGLNKSADEKLGVLKVRQPNEVDNHPEPGHSAEAADQPSEARAARGQISEKNKVPPQTPTTPKHQGVDRGMFPSSPLDVLGKLKRYYGDKVDEETRSPHDQNTLIVDNLGKKNDGISGEQWRS